MTKRLDTIFNLIPKCAKFADIGCDHGFIAQRMLTEKKCERAIVSDISAKSLNKAERLLKPYIDGGKAVAIVSDGFEKLPRDIDVALIAGLGGEEICKILSVASDLPKILILQPMKNILKVRKTLFAEGYGFKRDFTFKDIKFYNLIFAEKGYGTEYSEVEYAFGRENLKTRGNDFIDSLQREISLLEKYKKNVVSFSDLAELNSKIALLREVIGDEN